MLTTSPVASRLGSVAPSRLACRTVTWMVRYAAASQLKTANRCRMMPATAWTSAEAEQHEAPGQQGAARRGR